MHDVSLFVEDYGHESVIVRLMQLAHFAWQTFPKRAILATLHLTRSTLR